MGKRGHHPIAFTHGFNIGEGSRRIYKGMVGGVMRNHAEIVCSKCDAADVILMKAILPEDVIGKKFRQKGWDLEPDTCPACVAARREPTTEKEEDTMAEVASNVTPLTPPMPSKDSIRAQARLMRLLTDFFDGDAGAYINDYSDERVAKEVGLSLSVVEAFRREAFGDLKEPKELQAIKDDVTMLEMRIEEEFAGLTKSFAAEFGKLRTRLAELERMVRR
jgi:hypothetical protein